MSGLTKETTDAQNMIARLEKEIYLNIENPRPLMRRQFNRVKKAILDLYTELDVINIMKDDIE